MIFDSIYYEINGKSILKGVYLKLVPGKICGLFGLNGSGKTTILKIGAGILIPTNGTIFLDGEAFIQKKLRKRYLKLSYLPQETLLPRDITVSRILKNLSNEARDYVMANFPSSHIPQRIGTLSGGRLRLLELLVIISLNRQVILLDEPFTGIEPLYIEKMMLHISEQSCLGRSVLVTDHYSRYSAEISHYGYFMKNQTCQELEEGTNLAEQLRDYGYLKSVKSVQ